jgi:hypothetical protein
LDSSIENKVIATNSTLITTPKKFGTHSIYLVNNSLVRYIEIPNNVDFAWLLEDFTITFWIYISKLLDTNDSFILYSQVGLNIYLYENKLIIGDTTLPELAYITYTLNNSLLNNFQHIALVRKDLTLTLYINGSTIATLYNNYEYTDYDTVIRLGQKSSINTLGLFIYMDEFAVYRRNALYTTPTFTVPSAPYTS